MTRLRCGAVVSGAFIDYLESVYEKEQHLHPGEIFVIEYLRCADGNRAGKAWWTQCWASRDGMPDYQIHRVGGVEVYLPSGTAAGLSGRFVDYKDDEIRVT